MSGRICFLSAAHPAEDKRVFQKEATSLAAAGFDVTHLCPGPAARTYESRGVSIVEYPRRGGKLARLAGLRSLYGRARSLGADAYHCNEPDSWVVGILLRLTTGARVVFDCHEHYPGQVTRWLPRGTRALGRVATQVVLQVLGMATHVLVLAKPSIASDLSLSRRRHVLVLNTTSLRYLPDAPPAARDREGPFTFVHLGVFRRERGSEQLLQAMRELRRRGQEDIRVVLIGEFTDGSEADFLGKASEWGLTDQLELHPWMEFGDAFTHVSASDAGLVLFQRGAENNVRGMPHKMFDYMVAGLPVIAPSFAPDIVHVIGPSGAGVLLDTSDPDALADAMQALMNDRDHARELGANGRAAVLKTYNWEAEADKLVAAYRDLLGRAGEKPPRRRTGPVRRRVHRLVYLARSYSWPFDPRVYLRRGEPEPIDRPIFLLGTQGGGLTLLSRMLRRNPVVISAAGSSRYWTAADEMQNVFGIRLPPELTGLRYKAPPHPVLTAPRSWTYAADDLLPSYRRTAADATVELKQSLERWIRYCGSRYGSDEGWRFLDKSQVFSVRLGLVHRLLEEWDPRFVFVVRDPYTAVYRAAVGGAADMRRLADDLGLEERLDICAQHYANTARAVLEDADERGIDVPIVRFEDLLRNPEEVLRRVCSHTGLEFRPDMLPAAGQRLPLGSRYAERWFPLRVDVNDEYAASLDPQVVEAVDKHFGSLVEVLGYAHP